MMFRWIYTALHRIGMLLFKDDFTKINDELKTVNVKHNKIESSIGHLVKDLSTSKHDIKMLYDRFHELAHEFSLSRQDIKKIYTRIDGSNKVLTRLSIRLQSLREEFDYTRTSTSTRFSKNIESFRRSDERLKKLREEFDQTRTSLSRQMSSNIESSKRIEQRLGELRDEFDHTRSSLNTKIQSSTTNQSQFNQRLRGLRDEFDYTRTSLTERTQNTIEALKRNNKRLSDLNFDKQKIDSKFTTLNIKSVAWLKSELNTDFWLSKNKGLHAGERCFLLGCGPSLNKVDLSLLHGEYIMGVNGTYMIDGLSLTYIMSISHVFWLQHYKGLQNVKCKRSFYATHMKKLKPESPVSWINLIEKKHCNIEEHYPPGFSFNPERCIIAGGTVIYACIQILLHLGFNEIILLGVDHDYGFTKKEYPKNGLVVSGNELNAHFTDKYYKTKDKIHIDMPSIERSFKIISQIFNERGLSIVNASPESKLTQIQRVDYNTLF